MSLTFRLTTFHASGTSLVAVVDDAKEQANAWLERHQWRTLDSHNMYSVQTYTGQTGGIWECSIVIYGPIEETPLDQ